MSGSEKADSLVLNVGRRLLAGSVLLAAMGAAGWVVERSARPVDHALCPRVQIAIDRVAVRVTIRACGELPLTLGPVVVRYDVRAELHPMK